MPIRLRASIVSLLAAIIAIDALSATVTVRPPSHSTVECEAHVALIDNAIETTGRCGAPLEIGAGAAVAWVEDSRRISSATMRASGGAVVRSPKLVPAAAVIIAPARPLGEGEHPLLIGWNPAEGAAPFIRPVSAEAIKSAHRVPDGRVVGMVVDRRRNVLALTKPTTVTGAGVVSIIPSAATDRTDLVAFLDRPEDSGDRDRVSVALLTGDGRREPDVFLDGGDGIIAVWYGIRVRAARLTIDSTSLRLPIDAIDLARTGVTTIRDRLQRRPSLAVAIGALPDSVDPQRLPPLNLTVFDAKGDTALVPRASATAGRTYEFRHLPAAPLLVMLEIGAFKTGGRADLTDGRDARIEIPLEPVPISGTVFFGDSPASAEIRFLQKGEPVKTTTDDRGRFAVTLWEERRYFVDVSLLDHPDVPPFEEVRMIAANDTIDLHVPANRFAAHVFDRDSGKAVAKATLTVRNSWSGATGRESSVRSFASDATVVTELPPQRPGTTELRVSAPGYADFGPLVIEVDRNVHERIIDVPMRPLGDSVEVDVRLSDGAPAAGAEVAISPDGNEVSWGGKADQSGHADVPKSMSGLLLLVRHPSAASASTVLVSADATTTVRLERAAEPLTINTVVTDDSRNANAIFAWIGGTRLGGAALGFVSWSTPLSDRDRRWTARNLPAGPLRILAVRPPRMQQAAGGMFDAVAQAIPYPWPTEASVRVIE